jgi:hypothetical protein
VSIEKPTPEEIEAKGKMIRSEKSRLNKLLKELPGEKKKAAAGLIEECAFMRATLYQYRGYMDVEGLIDIMQQGDYSIKREHPAVRSYTSMIQKYATVSKQLFDMLPNKQPPPTDDFDNFRNSK